MKSKQKLEPLKKTRRGLSPFTQLHHLNAQPCSENVVSPTASPTSRWPFVGSSNLCFTSKGILRPRGCSHTQECGVFPPRHVSYK